MMVENKARPFNAYEGGAKVLGAIKEVLEHGGSMERAVANGEAALHDLRRSTAEISPPGEVDKGIPVYASRDATDDVLGKDGGSVRS